MSRLAVSTLTLLAVLVLSASLGGCTAVHYLKRNECWVRQSVPWHGVVSEELGPCTRAQPKWSEDRFTRLLQECVAQSDYRWQYRALEAWRQDQPLPERDLEVENEECALRASTEVLARNESLEQRLNDLAQDRKRLDAQNERLALELGKAANKPAGSAVAHASAHGEGSGRGDGASQNTHDSSIHSSSDSLAHPSSPQPAPAPAPKSIPGPSPSIQRVAKQSSGQAASLSSAKPELQPSKTDSAAKQGGEKGREAVAKEKAGVGAQVKTAPQSKASQPIRSTQASKTAQQKTTQVAAGESFEGADVEVLPADSKEAPGRSCECAPAKGH